MLLNKIIEKLIHVFMSRKKYAQYVGVKLGDNCRIYTTNFGSEPYLINIGDNVTLSNDVQLITHDGGVWVIRNKYPKYKNIDLIAAINIGSNVFIGANSIILAGVSIGDNIIVGAGSIVTKDLPSGFVYIGVPARKHCSIEEYTHKNQSQFINTKQMNSLDKKKYLLENSISNV